MARALLFLLAALAGCSAHVQPADISYGQQQCERHGGLLSVGRYEHGRHLLIVCRDETMMEVRFKEPRNG